MAITRRLWAWLAERVGPGRELAARLAYVHQRRQDLAHGPDRPEPEAIEALESQAEAVRRDLAAGRFTRAAIALNDLDERLAALEMAASDAALERQAHEDRIARLRGRIARARMHLGMLRLAGIGSDGLAMLEARLARAEHGTTVAAIAAAEAETAAVERALARLAERTGNHLTQN